MHRPIFGHSFAVLVATILLSVLAVKFLNKKRASVDRNAEDADAGASDLSTETNSKDADASASDISTETNAEDADASASDSSTETNAEDADGGAPDSSTETNLEDADASAPDSLTETNLGASSSSTTPMEFNDGTSRSTTMPIGGDYEVFLSFRGADTRHGFTDHLYNALVDAGIHAFRDDEELRTGERIGPDLLAAIKNSKILIPILSVNYGRSRWCLDELVQIMECQKNSGHLVLPIYYKVGPADVRYQKGSFGDAFHERERRSDPEILKKWKEALRELSDLKGWEARGDESELIRLVIGNVFAKLTAEFRLIVTESLVGIDHDAKKVVEFVKNNSRDVLFIGIHGMEGIGKTTLAKTIYNMLLGQFKYRSYIPNIREASKREGIVYLQNQLISDIFRLENEVHDVIEGIAFLSFRFKRKKALILLDDVDADNQLEALAGNHDWFSSGSIILITTRNKLLLDNASVDYDYEHKQLDEDQSLILFSKHAFRKDSPPIEFEDLTHVVVSTIGGLPSSLEALGSLLRGKGRAVWMDTIAKFTSHRAS